MDLDPNIHVCESRAHRFGVHAYQVGADGAQFRYSDSAVAFAGADRDHDDRVGLHLPDARHLLWRRVLKPQNWTRAPAPRLISNG